MKWTTGYYFKLKTFGAALSWRIKKKVTVALYPSETELHAMEISKGINYKKFQRQLVYTAWMVSRITKVQSIFITDKLESFREFATFPDFNKSVPALVKLV